MYIHSVTLNDTHHSPGAQIVTRCTQRPIDVNFFLEFTTKDLILREAWKNRKIKVGGRLIYFYHDNVLEIVRKCQEYNAIKKALKQKGSLLPNTIHKHENSPSLGSLHIQRRTGGTES